MPPEREGTPEDFARLAAAIRGQDVPAKQAQNQGGDPPPEPEPDAEGEELLARLLQPKAGHLELIRRMHGSEEE